MAEVPITIGAYSDEHPHIPAVQMIRFQDGRNAGLAEAAGLVERVINELTESNMAGLAALADRIRALHFVQDGSDEDSQ